MPAVSLGGVGMYVFVLGTGLRLLGLEVDESVLTETVVSVIQLIGFATWIYGQLRRKDLKWGLVRK